MTWLFKRLWLLSALCYYNLPPPNNRSTCKEKRVPSAHSSGVSVRSQLALVLLGVCSRAEPQFSQIGIEQKVEGGPESPSYLQRPTPTDLPLGRSSIRLHHRLGTHGSEGAFPIRTIARLNADTQLEGQQRLSSLKLSPNNVLGLSESFSSQRAILSENVAHW